MEEIKDRLKNAMHHRGLNQTKLAELTNIHVGTISNYILGKYKPKQDKIYLLAKVLNVDEAWLMGYDVLMKRTIVGFDTDPDISAIKKDCMRIINSLDSHTLNSLHRIVKDFEGRSLSPSMEDVELTNRILSGEFDDIREAGEVYSQSQFSDKTKELFESVDELNEEQIKDVIKYVEFIKSKK